MSTEMVSVKISSRLDEAARYTVYLSLIFMSLSPVISNLFMFGIVLTLLAGNFKQKFEIAKSFKMNWIALLLMIIFFIGIFLNPYGLKLGFHGFQKDMHRVLAPLFLIPLFVEEKHRLRAMNALIIGGCLAALIVAFHVPMRLATIPLSVLFAYVMFVLMNRLLDAENKVWRWSYALATLFLFYVLFFVNGERSGMLVFFVLLVMFGYQRLRIKGLAIACFSVVFLFLGIFVTSQNFKSRILIGAQNIVAFHHHQTDQGNSLGMRLLLSEFALHHIAEKPFFGHGTGMYARGVDDPADLSMRHGLETSENSYLDIVLDLGLVGLLVFVAWLGVALFETKRLCLPEKYLAQGLVMSMIVNCATVPAFNIDLSATMFVLSLVVLFGSANHNRMGHSP